MKCKKQKTMQEAIENSVGFFFLCKNTKRKRDKGNQS